MFRRLWWSHRQQPQRRTLRPRILKLGILKLGVLKLGVPRRQPQQERRSVTMWHLRSSNHGWPSGAAC
ncbi:MAG: hypothetical protein CMJ75_10130 [Planctomycetaceae bacterium]|nr:hypothetical protein [Planctomycetaceae bacterium]